MKSKFIVIPLIALLVAIMTVGAVPGMAGDTSANESASSVVSESDTLTYVSQSVATEPPIDEVIGDFISSNLGEDIKDAEGPIRSFSEMMSDILHKIQDFLNAIIEMLTGVGGGLGGLGGGLI